MNAVFSIDALASLSPSHLKLLVMELQAKLARAEDADISIIGMAGRYPGAGGTLAGFWEMLSRGQPAPVGQPPDDRPYSAASPDRDTAQNHACFVNDICAFDASAFGMKPGEAEITDPQLRVALEVAWEALEDAGCGGAGRVESAGVFLGITTNDFADMLRSADLSKRGDFAIGNSHGIFAARISHALRLKGPSMAINSVCASSLIAVQQAAAALRQGKCDIALAGGVNAILTDHVNRDLGALGIISRSGRCRPFDAGADGYVRGEGCGFVVMQRSDAARRAGRRQIASIKGIGINHDGDGVLMSPSRQGLKDAMHSALREAGLPAKAVGHIEAGSIGAPFSDAIEAAAINDVYGGPDRTEPLTVGSVKPLIGHLEAASGIAALTAAALMIDRDTRVSHPSIETPNPHVDWHAGQIKLGRTNQEDSTPKVIGVNTVSLSGTNVHVLLGPAASAETVPDAQPDGLLRPLLFSARAPSGLSGMAQALADRLDGGSVSFPDMVHTLAAGRSVLPCRGAVIAASASEAQEQLAGYAAPDAPACQAPRLLTFGADVPDGLHLPAVEDRKCDLMAKWTALGGAQDDALAQQLCSGLSLAHHLQQIGFGPDAVTGEGIGALVAARFAGMLDDTAALELLHRHKTDGAQAPVTKPPRLRVLPAIADGAALLRTAFGTPDRPAQWEGRLFHVSGSQGAFADPRKGFAQFIADAFLDECPLDLGAVAQLYGGALAPLPVPAFQHEAYWPRNVRTLFGNAEAGMAFPPTPKQVKAVSTEDARRIIATILKEEIGLTEEDHGKNLIDAGASSLEMFRAVARMQDELGFDPDLDAFLADPSIDGLLAQYSASLPKRETAKGQDAASDEEEGWI